MPALRCASCGSPYPGGAKFCPECGSPVPTGCPQCGAPVAGGRFCAQCGSPLGGTDATSQPPAGQRVPGQPSPAGSGAAAQPRLTERRVTSVLFADFVGFTPLAESRDPEEVRDLLSEYFATARTVVERYGGTVEKFIGDAVMAVWGVPTAHEDDAERAVRAGLDLVAAVEELGERVGAPQLAVRVGVVTGEVAVNLAAVGEGMVAGDAVNTAARVQGAAGPGQVWVDEHTRALSAAAVSYTDAGEHFLKGKSAPVRLHAARAVIAGRGGAQRVDGLEAEFVGRDRELRLVKELFHTAADDGRPQLVAVFGDAGSGKSRLTWEFEKYVDGLRQTVLWHQGRCLSYGGGVAFWALAQMVRSRLTLAAPEGAALEAASLPTLLAEWVGDPDEREWLAPRLATLLGLDDPGDGSPGFAREDLFGAWATFFERLSGADSCVVLVVEDMQFADPGLLDFIDHLVGSASFPLFVLTLARPELTERRPGWGTGRRATAVYLEPLTATAMGRLVDSLVDGLPPATRTALVERAEGVPLYALETVRALIDRDAVLPREGRYVFTAGTDDVDLARLGAPASLHALVAARLDALSTEERQAVQDASVLGSAFAADTLAAVSRVPDLPRVLESLSRKEIVSLHTDRFSADRGQYRFVQTLFRTVAYETLSRRDRKSAHLAVAAQLEERSQADELAAVIARHYLDALACGPDDPDATELTATALRLLARAARRAESLGAPEEALGHYLDALAHDPDPDTRAALHEGAAGVAVQLGRQQEALRHAEAAVDDYTALGRPVDAGRATAVAGSALTELGNNQAAVDLLAPVYEKLADDPTADRTLLLLSRELARAHMYLNEPGLARAYADRGLALAEALQDRVSFISMLARYGTIWLTNNIPTAGMALLQTAVQLARENHQPAALVSPLMNIAAFSNSRDLAAARAAARECVEVCRRLGSRQFEARAANNLSIGCWLSGDWDEMPALHREQSAGGPIERQLSRLLVALVVWARGSGELVTTGTVTADDPTATYYHRLADAVVAAAEGRRPDAARLAAEAVMLAQAVSGLDDDFCLSWPVAVEEALGTGDLPGASALVDVVATAPAGLVPRYVRAQLLRLRALVADATGSAEPEAVLADLTAAADELRAFGARFYLGRALLERGQLLVKVGRETEAAPVLAEAGELFRALQAAPWLTAAAAVSAAASSPAR